ncbi:sphingosine kinase 2 isoform X1 [Cryptomeria japonica]|uniref:sphingosine kinase 2 isoform X1 n=1 Tax=Cryptomeria japonica TaxID=3369 RepID=UPI0027DA7DEA|nr:sphingosine kinase 2 isoform X1 [Cryptomeria japonica]
MEAAKGGEEKELLISEEVQLNGVDVTVSLSSQGLIRWSGGSTSGCLSVENDLLGFSRENESLKLHGFMKHEATGLCWVSRPGHRVLKELRLKTNSEESLNNWCFCIQRCLDALDRPKRLLVLLNPFGGNKCAQKIFQEEVKPLLDIAGVSFTLQETQFQCHAKDLAKAMDLSMYDGILCISGDGILVEVVNGLLERPDWENAIKMPLGIVPAGTGNGMIKSLMDHANEPCIAMNATFAVIKGHKQALDVAVVTQGQVRSFSVLMLTWGLVADIDIESEKYRWMGSMRLDFYTFVRIFRLRHYSGNVSFIPAPGYEEYGEPISIDNENGSILQDTGISGTEEMKPKTSNCLGALDSSENYKWKSINGQFIIVWLHNVPWGSQDIMPAPHAEFSDGYVDLVIVKKCPKWSLLSLLLKMKDGGHVKSRYVQYLKVKAFRLSPGGRTGSSSQGGIIDVDGEVLAMGKGSFGDNDSYLMSYGPPIQVTVEKGLATIFCP